MAPGTFTHFAATENLKTNYKGILNILGVLYVDRICTEDHFLENRIKTFPSVQKYSDLFMIHTFFPLRVISIELYINLSPQCNIVDFKSKIEILNGHILHFL